MYTAYHNDQLFYSSASSVNEIQLISGEVQLTAGAAGTFTFTIAPDNMAYTTIDKMKSYIDVYRDDELIFAGRVYSVQESFDKILTVTCEGLFAVLNDSVVRPGIWNGTLAALISEIVLNHNAQVDSAKQIEVGTLLVEDDYVFRQYDQYTSTMERLQELVDSYGGYMSIRKENNTLYLDWTEEYTGEGSQHIDFGENLLDVTQATDASELITVLVPLGAEIEDPITGVSSRLTIAGIQEQLGRDYIEKTSAINRYGRIVGIMTWDDVTVDTKLLQKATAYLNKHSQSILSINVNAVDLGAIDLSIDKFKVGTKIWVESAPHNISQYCICLAQHLNLVDPSADQMVLGAEQKGYLKRQSSKLNKLIRQTNSIVCDYATNSKLTETNNNVTALTEVIENYYTMIEQNAEAINLRATIETTDELSGRLSSVESDLEVTADNISMYFGEDGAISTWYSFDEDKMIIGKSGSKIHTEQDNDSYAIVDSDDNVLLEITPEGTRQETAEVERQVKFSYGGAAQWAIREAKYISGIGVNLNDVWIGG